MQSSVPAGTPLKGLNFYKNKTDPVAMEDSEYPSWLWTALTPEGKKEEAAEGDLFCKFSTGPSLTLSRLRFPRQRVPSVFLPPS